MSKIEGNGIAAEDDGATVEESGPGKEARGSIHNTKDSLWQI